MHMRSFNDTTMGGGLLAYVSISTGTEIAASMGA